MNRSRSTPLKKKLALILTSFFLTILLIEAIIATFLMFPSLVSIVPSAVANAIRQVYWGGIAKLPQFDSRCATYSPSLFYILSRACTFENPEFRVDLLPNSLGVRDSEDSLNRPEVIVLGDSHSMGWGVEEKEAFPALLEDHTKVRVLNASLPSYGTAREMRLLSMADSSHLKHLVIQYCSNDYSENTQVAKLGALTISPEKRYRTEQSNYLKSRTYFPGKYSGLLLTPLWVRGQELIPAPEQEAEAFIEVLSRLRWPEDVVPDINLIVFDLTSRTSRPRFLQALQKSLSVGRSDGLMRGIKKASVLDIHEFLDERSFFPIDGHLNTKGHRQVAGALFPKIKSIEVRK